MRKRTRGWTWSCTTRAATISSATLFSTSACHLCEQARALVIPELGPGWELREVDISESDELFDRYGLLIPVLAAEGAEAELNWPFSAADVRALLASATS